MKPFVLAGSWSSHVKCIIIHIGCQCREISTIHVLSIMIHPPHSNQIHPKESHLSEVYLYVHRDIRLLKYQIIQICHKNVLMNKYQKVLKEAAHICGCGRIGCLIYRFETFFFSHRLRLKKQTNQRRCITSKKMHGCGAISLVEPYPFLSLLLSSPHF